MLAIDGRPVDARHPLDNVLVGSEANTEVTLTIVRDGKERQVKVPLGEPDVVRSAVFEGDLRGATDAPGSTTRERPAVGGPDPTRIRWDGPTRSPRTRAPRRPGRARARRGAGGGRSHTNLLTSAARLTRRSARPPRESRGFASPGHPGFAFIGQPPAGTALAVIGNRRPRARVHLPTCPIGGPYLGSIAGRRPTGPTGGTGVPRCSGSPSTPRAAWRGAPARACGVAPVEDVHVARIGPQVDAGQSARGAERVGVGSRDPVARGPIGGSRAGSRPCPRAAGAFGCRGRSPLK